MKKKAAFIVTRYCLYSYSRLLLPFISFYRPSFMYICRIFFLLPISLFIRMNGQYVDNRLWSFFFGNFVKIFEGLGSKKSWKFFLQGENNSFFCHFLQLLPLFPIIFWGFNFRLRKVFNLVVLPLICLEKQTKNFQNSVKTAYKFL